MRRLKTSELPAYRDELIRQQGGVCALTGEKFTARNPAVCDHDHTTGRIRGVLTRGANSMLGVIENNAPRYQLTNPAVMARFLRGLQSYLGKDHGDVLYPTHRSDDEKRELRNKRARAARAARKAAA